MNAPEKIDQWSEQYRPKTVSDCLLTPGPTYREIDRSGDDENGDLEPFGDSDESLFIMCVFGVSQGAGGRRHAKLTTHAQRLTPVEVAQHWFRRGAVFANDIHATYSNFPKPGPDGLYLLSDVEAWFDDFHGRKEVSSRNRHDKDAAMRAAHGQ